MFQFPLLFTANLHKNVVTIERNRKNNATKIEYKPVWGKQCYTYQDVTFTHINMINFNNAIGMSKKFQIRNGGIIH